MNPLGALLTVVLSLIVFGASRRVAALAVVCGVCYLTQGLNLKIGFNFTAIRIILLAGFFRVITRGELKKISFTPVDRALIAYGVCQLVVSTFRVGEVSEFVYQLGNLYNVCLSYFVFRALLEDEEDIFGFLKKLAFALVPFVLIIYLEANSGRNLFAIFPGIGETMYRDGHFRAQAAFRSPITAGSFGANFAMIYIAMIFSNGKGQNALFGLALSLIIAIPCARSSGPVLGLLTGVVALACWRFREHTKLIRWGIVVTLVSLQIVMKSPVWFLLGRISDLVGGGGYHRAYIIDHFVNSFSSWWFDGMNDTSSWMPTLLESGGSDLTNQFVSDGVSAGLIGLVLSITLLVRCFQAVGQGMTLSKGQFPDTEKFLWGLGAALVGNIGILFSVTYFDQMHVIWFSLLTCIASVSSGISKKVLKSDNFAAQGTVQP